MSSENKQPASLAFPAYVNEAFSEKQFRVDGKVYTHALLCMVTAAPSGVRLYG